MPAASGGPLPIVKSTALAVETGAQLALFASLSTAALPVAAQAEHDRAAASKGKGKAGDPQTGWPTPPAGRNESQYGRVEWETPADEYNDVIASKHKAGDPQLWVVPPGWNESEYDDAVKEVSEDEWLKLSMTGTTVDDGHLNSSELVHERSQRSYHSWSKGMHDESFPRPYLRSAVYVDAALHPASYAAPHGPTWVP